MNTILSRDDHRQINDPNNLDRGKHLYIWLDILGFSEEVNREVDSGSANGSALPNLLQKFKKTFIDDLWRLQYIVEGKMISDGIVLDLGVFAEKYKTLKEIFEQIGEKQLSFMLEEGRLIRGGMALGKTLPLEKESEKEGHYISSGLTRAYGIESKHTHWPIIATTKQQLDEMKKILNMDDFANPFGLVETFNKNAEKIYFIDFLCNSHDYKSYAKCLEILLNKVVDDNMMSDNQKAKIYDKHIWLFQYLRTKDQSCDIHSFFQGVVL